MAAGDLTNVRYANSSSGITLSKMSDCKINIAGTLHNITKVIYSPTTIASDAYTIWQKTTGTTFDTNTLDANFAIYDSTNDYFEFILTQDITTLNSDQSYPWLKLTQFNAPSDYTTWVGGSFTVPSYVSFDYSGLTITQITINGTTGYLHKLAKYNSNVNVLGIGVATSQWGTITPITMYSKSVVDTTIGISSMTSVNFAYDTLNTGTWYTWLGFTSQTFIPVRQADV